MEAGTRVKVIGRFSGTIIEVGNGPHKGMFLVSIHGKQKAWWCPCWELVNE